MLIIYAASQTNNHPMKHKILLFVLASLMVALNGEAQDFWEVLPFPDGTNIHCIAVNNEGDIFVGVGNDGAPGGVYRSLDNGHIWELVLNTGNLMVQSIAISQSGKIFVGRTGIYNFMVSEDNGLSWNEIQLPSHNNVMKILCIDQDTVYVSLWEDGGGLVIRSPDCGQTWETVFTSQNVSEYVSDIEITDEGIIYLSLRGYQSGQGGVYKSANNGVTWEFIGLFDCMVSSLAVNSAGDLFAGSWGGTSLYCAGVYVLRNGHQVWDTLTGGQIADMVINSEGHIYCSSSWPDGVIRSLDNGASFQLITGCLPQGAMDDIYIDNLEYIYVLNNSCIARSLGPTVTVPEPDNKAAGNLFIYPDPASDFLNICVGACMVEHVITISVHDITGKTVYVSRTPLDSSGIQLPVSDLPAGLYIVKLAFPNHIRTSKFVKL